MDHFFEVAFDTDSLNINVGNSQHLLDGCRLACHKAGPKVEQLLIQFDAGFARRTSKAEVVLGSTDDGHLKSVVLELSFRHRQVRNLHSQFASLLNCSCFRSDGHGLVDRRTFPNEIKVELTFVLQYDIFGAAFVDEELSEVESHGFTGDALAGRSISQDLVMDLVAFTLNIEDKRTGLALDIAHQVVVVGQFVFGAESNLNRHLTEGRHGSTHWGHFKGVSKVWATLHRSIGEVEGEGNVLLVDDTYSLFVLSGKEKGSKLQLTLLE